MVENISLNIFIASLNIEHNYLIPSDMSVDSAAELIAQTLVEEYPGVKKGAPGGHRLMQASTGKILTPGCSFKQLGIVQGEKLLIL